MSQQVETILDKAIAELQNGVSLNSVIEHFPEFEHELQELEPVLFSLANLPKAGVPRAEKQRRYILSPSRQTGFEWITSMLRLGAMPAGIFAGIMVVSLTAYAANNSKPGQHLFAVKKSIEKTALVFTPENQQTQAKLALTEKRLLEATEILSSPNPDPKAAKAALNELSSQTNDTISDVKKVANNKNLSPAEVTVLNTLATITKKQEDLITSATTEDQTDETKAEATQQAKLASKDIRELIAAVNDKALANLAADNDEVIISGGTITSIDKAKVTVEKTIFNIDPKTIIVEKGDETFDFAKLTLKTKITITGTKTDKGIQARKIVVIELPETGTVKGDSIKVNPIKKPVVEPIEETNTPPAPNNNLTGTFIPEQP
jgi:hypothetical protein